MGSDPHLNKNGKTLAGVPPAKLDVHQPSPHLVDANPCTNFSKRATIVANLKISSAELQLAWISILIGSFIIMGNGMKGDDYTYGILMKGFYLTNRIGDGFKLLQVMKSRGVKVNDIMYNMLIYALCKNGKTVSLAFQTLGVVYGDMVTSPLYVFSDVFTKVPITLDVDVFGTLSLVMYTIALIPLTKYIFVVLKANDNREGGTFALYSLICRYANVNLLPNRQPSDEHISSFKLMLPSGELERAINIKEFLEHKSHLKKNSIIARSYGNVYGYRRWYFDSSYLGIYNLLKYDITVVRVVNPAYIYFFFKKNSTKAISALGGCVLRITGAEAMFADLGHFSVPSIQLGYDISFVFVREASDGSQLLPEAEDNSHFKKADGPDLHPCHQLFPNYFLMVMCITVDAVFKSTTQIANAYG
ncbi:putative potassium transporter 12 [Phtheirospermum japonicum]|uniref:Putative potassium transporter 12 n=1 Tax=Phtheirospermum japonicum TaxID=374723 RepID=A0A830DFT5_9LAMI|nr:putative potassium transporter 12 [Phtheirospermum japonicum]